MYVKKSFQINIILVLFVVVFQPNIFSQNKVDSLLNILLQAENKSEIYNLLSEATLEDSLELSFEYAQKALNYSIRENSLQQKGMAYSNMAEVFACQYQLDSAKHYYTAALGILKKTGDNYNTSFTLNNLGWLFSTYGQFQDAIGYYVESLEYLNKEVYADELSHVYVNIGNLYHQTGKYHTAIGYFNMAIDIGKSINYEHVMSYAYNGKGLAYKYLANYDSAMVYYKLMLEFDRKAGDENKLAIDYSNIGGLYFQWKQYRQALDFYNDALEIHKKHGSKNQISGVLSNIGVVYKEQGNYEKALDYFNQALSIDAVTGIELDKTVRYNNIGDVYFKQGNYQKALDYFQKSLSLNQKIGQKHYITINLHNIGKLYLKTGNYSKAQKYFKQGLQLADSLEATATVIEYLASLTELSKLSGDYKLSLAYHTRYSKLKDSIFKEKNQMALADMKTKYDVDKKEQEIVLLNNENKFQKLKVDAYKTKLTYLIAGLIIFGILSFFLILQYLYKNRAYNKLVERSKEYLDYEDQFKKLVLMPKINKTIKQEKDQKKNAVELKHIELIQNLLIYFEEGKPYLNQDITQKDIAGHLNTNPKYISHAINAAFNKNFNTFVNEYRIKLAMKYLANGVKKQYSIEGISEKVGFNSKSAFNIAFKKITGVTPSFYIKSLKKENLSVLSD